MKKLLIACLPCLLLFAQCSESNGPEGPETASAIDCTENAEACDLSITNTDFGFQLFRELHQDAPEENIFISPLSVATALSMTTNGAAGQTREDMMATLKQEGLEMERINKGFQQLLALLPALDPEVQLQLANSIWYRQGYPVHPDFLETNRFFFDSEVAALDFTDPAARETINGWVKENTNGLIESIIAQEIPADVVMYLINAIYFKGTWLRQFDPEQTAPADFQLEGGSTTEVNMMNLGQTILPYFETETFHAADLAYGDSLYTMSVLLPKPGATVGQVVAELNQDNWNRWATSFRDQELFFSMPKFEMEYEESLVKPLSRMGMSIAFSGGADFSNIADASLLIDEVLHKSFIEVNEEGTEAAAVTSVVIVETSVPDIPFMVLNRPFLFLIRERSTNAVLFIGKMMNPNAS